MTPAGQLNLNAALIYTSLIANEAEHVFIPILKKGNAKECSNYHTIELI